MELRIVPEILVVKEFKILVDRDTSISKEQAKKDLATVAFLVMPNSPFNKYEEGAKLMQIQKTTGSLIDAPIRNAVKKYQELFYDFSIEALLTSIETVKKTLEFYKELDYGEKDKSGKLIYKPKEINASLKEMPGVLSALQDAMDRVKIGMAAKSIIARGQRTVSRGEIPKEINRIKEEDI